MLLNETGFDALMDFLMLHHRVFSARLPKMQNMHAWAREAEESQGVVEIKSFDSVSGHTVALTLPPDCFDDEGACE
jgi:hypothetical protein